MPTRSLFQLVLTSFIAVAILIRTFWRRGSAAPPKCPCPNLADYSYSFEPEIDLKALVQSFLPLMQDLSLDGLCKMALNYTRQDLRLL